jgi:hypothetical protein
MNMTIFNKNFLKSATARLRNQMTVNTSVSMVKHALSMVINDRDAESHHRNNARQTLHAIDDCFPQSILDKTMDRRRAQEITSQALAGMNAATYLSKSEKQTSTPTAELLRQAADVSLAMDTYPKQRALLIDKFITYADVASGGMHSSDTLDELRADKPVSAEHFFAMLKNSLLLEQESVSLKMEGIADVKIYLGDIIKRYNTSLAITFKSSELLLEYSFLNSEFESRDDMDVRVEWFGDNIEEYLIMDAGTNTSGLYPIDVVNDGMTDLFDTNFTLGEDDLFDPFDAQYRDARELLMRLQ